MDRHNDENFNFDIEYMKLDPNVIAQLPQNCRVISVKNHGISFWANTERIDVELADGTRQSFFIKVMAKEQGMNMAKGEFESMRAIYEVTPHFVPKPIAWGSYGAKPKTYFFLCEFRDMAIEMPDPKEFTLRLSELHKNSKSPNGKFGFHIPTYSGNLPQMTEWEDSWQIFFEKSLRFALHQELEANGLDPEFDILVPIIFSKVIPKLLGPLESDGRRVKPSLVHGDLWYGNSGVDVTTGYPLIFDACCFYAHNEYEFGQWRPACNKFDEKYLEEYHSHSDGLSLDEGYEGRLDLYKLRFNVHVSALFKSKTLRGQVLNDMRDLVARYG
ncbi:Fructosamine kinase-domain-containing protein [Xylogone sp. PMI_703]|nr:Fructosamine kinase-domain-containing protein [Xylogone sp. PMI_703]